MNRALDNLQKTRVMLPLTLRLMHELNLNPAKLASGVQSFWAIYSRDSTREPGAGQAGMRSSVVAIEAYRPL